MATVKNVTGNQKLNNCSEWAGASLEERLVILKEPCCCTQTTRGTASRGREKKTRHRLHGSRWGTSLGRFIDPVPIVPLTVSPAALRFTLYELKSDTGPGARPLMDRWGVKYRKVCEVSWHTRQPLWRDGRSIENPLCVLQEGWDTRWNVNKGALFCFFVFLVASVLTRYALPLLLRLCANLR